MKPITRKEHYLAKAAGTYTGPTPPPVLREDYYLATLAGDYSGNCPAPVTRIEKYMSAAAGLTSYIPQPVTRIEKYWYAIVKGTGYVPEPVTREEQLLYAIIHKEPQYIDKTADGSTILLTDSAEASFTALTLYGKSTQDGTPSPENPIPIVSAGSVMTTGKNVLPPETGAEVHMNIPAGTKCFLVTDGTPSNGGNVFLYDAEGNVYYLAIDAGATEIVGSYGTYNVDIVRFDNRLMPGVNTAMYIGEKLPYEPYTGGVPGVNPYEGEINVSVSDGGTQSQTLAISTPGGLPGIPVDSGGNYTDESGQQWICNEIDLARGKYVQRNCRLVLDGSEVWGAKYNENAQRFFFRYLAELPYKRQSGGILCTAFLSVDWGYNDPDANNSISFASDDVALQVSTTLFDGNVEEFKDWLTTNPMTVVYTIATPIETDLTAEEIAAYKALHTYSPATTVSNDAVAWMKVGYKATP